MKRTRWFGICVLVFSSACYAVPERHSVSNEAAGEGDGGGEDGGEDDPDAGQVRNDAGRRDGGTPDASACDCDSDRPMCIEATKTCVACTADAGGCRLHEVCDVLHGDCVECLQNSDCKDPNASVCDLTKHTCARCAESSESDCSHITDKHICLAGTCVQCTKDKLDACKVQQSATKTVQNACNALTHTCTENELRKTPPCGECVSDAQCMMGSVCVQMSFNGQPILRDWYCQPVLSGLNCGRQRPYMVLQSGATSIEGGMADICTLRASSCSAQDHYLKKYCGLDEENLPIALDDAGVPVAPSVKGDDSLCGLPGLDDGYCVEAQPGLHRCTVACGEVQDCPAVAPACEPRAQVTELGKLCTVL